MPAEEDAPDDMDRPGPSTLAGTFVASASIEVVPGEPVEQQPEEDGDDA